MDRTDAELIDDYSRGSQTALAALIRRHVDLVYAAGIRQTGDPGLADDVTQAVFIVLAKKAHTLSGRATIAGWLMVVTRHIARRAVRTRDRRLRHERNAAKPEATKVDARDASKTELADALDGALARLRARDREALALRFIQSRSLAETGHALGISEDAARKRVERGLERLRESLGRGGVALGAAGMSKAIESFAAPPAPSNTLATVTNLIRSPANPSAISLSNGELQMLALRKVTLMSIVLILGLSAVVGVAVFAQSTPAPSVAAAAVPAAPPGTTPPTLSITAMALQLPVTDVEANIAFFEKLGFRQRWVDTPDADGRLPRASVGNGVVGVRLYRVESVPQTDGEIAAYFWIEGGLPALSVLRDAITSRGITAGPLGKSINLEQFDVITPDGHKIGFYAQPS
jgi:RNA polymerase sigma factor (sigma-70 family)